MRDKNDNLRIKRVSNACVLIQMGKYAILTDPFFLNWKRIGIKEEVAISPKELPPLTAIIGCHAFLDHWQMQSLVEYPHNKDNVQVFVAMKSQIRSANKYGFNNAEVLQWGNQRTSGDLTIEAVKAQKMMMWRVNNYVLRSGKMTVFFGSEARDLKPLSEYRKKNGPVDVAIFPVNAVHLFGIYQLVMSGEQAVQGARLLGADTLFVIHDAHPVIPGLIHIKSSGDDADKAAALINDVKIEVVRIAPGIQWAYHQVN